MRAELEKVLSQLRYADETRSEAAEQDSICMNGDFLAKYGQELLVLTGDGGADSATLTALFGLFRQREQFGLAKYGATVDRSDLTPAQWRQHHREELMDALLYSLAEEREQAGWQPIETAPKDARIICAWFGSKEFTETSAAMFHTPIDAWCNPEDIRDRFGIPDLWMPWPSDPPHPGEAYIETKFPSGLMTVSGEEVPDGGG